MRFLTVARDFLDPATFPIEMVERKGVGHPDSLADALANEISVVFSRHCLERFGLELVEFLPGGARDASEQDLYLFRRA